MDESRRYEVQVDLSVENSSHTQMVLLTGQNKNVLEVGTSTGYVARALRERGCRVTGIELEAEMARIAEGSVDRMIVGDIESLDLAETLGDARFDVILFGDVLEHLVDPAEVLRRVTPFLAPGGRVVASIPNIAHGSIRLSLLAGDFTYTESGLLDRTHLRFFTREGVESLFANASFDIVEWRRVELGIFDTEAPIREEDVPASLREAVTGAPEARTFQFVVVAAPVRDGEDRTRAGSEPGQETAPFGPIWDVERELSQLKAGGATSGGDGAAQEAREASLLVEASEVPDEDREALLASHERLRGRREVRSVNWFVPDFDNAYYGGIHTILRFADRLEREHGVQNRVIVCGQGPEETVRAAIAEAFPALAKVPMIVAGDDPAFERGIPKADAGIATLWATTHPLIRSRSAERSFYLVQDFEPMFYPAGTLYALAEETYRFGLYGIANGPVLKELYESYGGRATSFVPAVDIDLFHPDAGRPKEEPFTVFMYGRPGHPRNCYEIGIAALRRLKETLGDRVRILAAGSTETSGTEDWIEHLGLLRYEETAELYRRCHAGLALSVSMHPSYIPFQLMASGALVVANRNPATGWLLRDRENALLAAPSPGALHDALLEGLTDTRLRERLTSQALADIRERHADWDAKIDEVFRFLEDPQREAPLPAEQPELGASPLDARKAALAAGEWRAFENRYRALIKEKDREIEERGQEIAERGEGLRREREVSDDLRAVLRGKAEQIGEKDLAIVKRDWVVSGLERRVAELERDRVRGLRGRARLLVERLAPFGTLRRELLRRAGLVRRALPPPRVPTGLVLEPGRDPDAYELWLHRNQLNDDRIAKMRDAIARFENHPTVSLIVPTYNSDPAWLGEAIDSVRAQVYEDWDLCIADDGSTRRETKAMLRRYARGDARIKVTFLRQNQGISGASNAALALATGEFVGLLDHDDVLHPEALFEVARVLNERSDTDFIYTDEDKLDVDGRRIEPFFKPDWSPDLLDSLNYVTHFSVFRKELVDRLGGFRKGFDGSQDYDLILRATEVAGHIEHVPRPVYSWRKVPGSAAASSDAKPYAYEAAKRALKESLTRRGYEGEVLDGPFTGHYRVRYALRDRPRVSIVIPTRDRLDLLGPCVESIRERTTYENYDIVIIDNDSEDPRTKEYLERFEGRVLPRPGPFNFAEMINRAVEQLDAPMVLLLNNDTIVRSEEWLEAMLEHAQRPEVAAVGARLLFPDGEPQHEGILVGTGGGLAANMVADRYGFGVSTRNCSAVTAACMLTRTEVFRELGGFDESLAVAYNDVDFCLRAREKGYLIVYTPHAELLHEQGGSRGLDGAQPPEDRTRFRSRWGEYRDPYYSPNFDIDNPFRLELEW